MNVVDKLPSLQVMLKHLQKVPYLSSKNMYRVATHFLHMDRGQLEHFCQALLHAHDRLVPCSTCCAWQEKDAPCQFCQNVKRDQKTVCVVESWQDLLAIEKSGAFSGVYHVLGGVICPLDGIGPEHLSIEQLIKRAPTIDEIIFATNQTPEGEATAAYIAHRLQQVPVKITCLACGVPVGSALEFLDRITVYKALAQRKEF